MFRRCALIALTVLSGTGLFALPARDAQAAGTPKFSVGDASVVEGEFGSRTVKVPITLSDASLLTTSVMYSITSGSATATIDFTQKLNKVLTFKPGITKKPVAVIVIGDASAELNETVTVTLSSPTGGAVLGRSVGTVTILNDDANAGVKVSVGDVSVVEGDSGGGTSGTVAQFAVTLNVGAPSAMTVQYTTMNGSALAGSDYTTKSGTISFAIGQYKKYVTVKITRDVAAEGASQAFAVTLSSPSFGLALGRGTATGTIIDDDTPPAPSTPVITATSPASPNLSNTPNVIGTSTAGSTVSLFFNPACSGAAVATGTAATFATTGIGVTVSNAATTTIYARATLGGPDSACSTGFAYTNTTTTTTALSAIPDPTTYGDSVTLTAVVSATSGSPTGTVEFFDGASSLGTAPLVAGSAELPVSTLEVGLRTLTASYLGSGPFLASASTPVAHTVYAIGTSIDMTDSPDPSFEHNTTTLTATVTAASLGPPTGTVQFFDGATLLGSAGLVSGIAVLETDDLGFGSHSLSAQYPGDAHYAASVSPLTSHEVLFAPFENWAWGDNTFGPGQLGDGTSTNRTSPTQIGTETEWSALDAATLHSLGIKTDGTLWSWGNNSHGQLGDGTTTARLSPVQVGAASNWRAVEAGGVYGVAYHSLGLRVDGTIWAWGSNESGQLGDGTTTDRWEPVQVGTGSNWVAIAAGAQHSLALKSDGTLWSWGNNVSGQLGDGTTTNRLTPVQVGTDTDWAAIESGQSVAFVSGASFSVALKFDGTLWTWGGNAVGQLGQGDATDRSTPTQVGVASNWTSISAGDQFAHAIKSDGTLWGWGRNDSGSLGDGTSTVRNSPVQIGTSSNWLLVRGGGIHTLALQTDGSLWTWGYNVQGQLGDGTTSTHFAPAQVGFDTDWIELAAGGVHSLGLRS
jgi:alpha-tubulin suppressor-like RCC1 family protein